MRCAVIFTRDCERGSMKTVNSTRRDDLQRLASARRGARAGDAAMCDTLT